MEIGFRSVNSNVREVAAGSEEFLAQLERLRDTDGLNGRTGESDSKATASVTARGFSNFGLRAHSVALE